VKSSVCAAPSWSERDFKGRDESPGMGQYGSVLGRDHRAQI